MTVYRVSPYISGLAGIDVCTAQRLDSLVSLRYVQTNCSGNGFRSRVGKQRGGFDNLLAMSHPVLPRHAAPCFDKDVCLSWARSERQRIVHACKQSQLELGMHCNQYAAKASLLANLSNKVRLQLLSIIVEKEVSVGDLAQKLNISQSALSQHLAKLRGEDLVSTRREAQTVYYRCEDKAVQNILGALEEIFKPETGPRAAATALSPLRPTD
ncbi:ArsR/SmtB family transcription factor [Rhizobium mongolense]|uniref:ArsR/SmtB family transcription factor n=1 Tax=Rhizobium mongolense TaxID=57676 RepID=UPI0035573AC0